ncbi:MAG: hypothetical protein ACFE8A_03095 [Candidatus Hodarchaeota archaeon]
MEMKDFNLIKLERKGKICILRLNRPAKKIAMSKAMRSEILAISQLLRVNNIFFDQYQAFEAEINSIIESMKKILNM